MIFMLSRTYRVSRQLSTKILAKLPSSDLKVLEKRPNHKVFADCLRDPGAPLVVGIGPAGCGKTLLSCAHAINRLVKKDIEKIVITRPAVSMDEQHGYLPGDLESKMLPWLIPIYDCFKEYVTAPRLKELIHNEEIEICPLSYIRGRTFSNCWVIADEVQNSSVNQMKTLLTRIGGDCKMILTGDLQQCDLKGTNGLDDFLKRYRYYSGDNENSFSSLVKIVEFEEDDIMRSEIVKHVLNIYEY